MPKPRSPWSSLLVAASVVVAGGVALARLREENASPELAAGSVAPWARTAAVTVNRRPTHALHAGPVELSQVHWEAPAPPLQLRPSPRERAKLPAGVEGAELFVSAYAFNASVFAGPAGEPRRVGSVRRGTLLAARGRVHGPGCGGGSWYALSAGGYICTQQGHAVFDHPKRFGEPGELPDPSAALPYRYAKARRHSLRYYRIPTNDELHAAETLLSSVDGGVVEAWPDPVERALDGAHFVGVAGNESVGDTEWIRTVQGRFLRADDVTPIEPAGRVGEDLRASGLDLPLAFVREACDVMRVHADGTVETAGKAERFARFEVQGTLEREGQRWVLGPGGLAVAAEAVRVARRQAPPEGVASGERWVHTDTGEQTVVAYEGAQPVYATLISSGIEGYDTPTGLFRIDAKYISRTMRGPDPDVGEYEVGQVPWTMYYSGGYALHGAYWHDEFGKTRSHGCTNLPPADARWLYYWTEPRVPEGWHGYRDTDKGSLVLVTE